MLFQSLQRIREWNQVFAMGQLLEKASEKKCRVHAVIQDLEKV